MADEVCPLPKHVFRQPLGLLRHQQTLIAVPQGSVLRGLDWLGQTGTKQDLKALGRIGRLIMGSAQNGPCWYVKFGSEGDAFPVPILAPPVRKLTQQEREGLNSVQRRSFVLESVGLGAVLTEHYIRSTHRKLECYDDCVEKGLPPDWTSKLCEDRDEAIFMLREEWERDMDEALSPLEAGGPLCYAVTTEVSSCNPYFMLGITKHGNVAGLMTSLTWT